jgi:hypothetical protein
MVIVRGGGMRIVGVPGLSIDFVLLKATIEQGGDNNLAEGVRRELRINPCQNKEAIKQTGQWGRGSVRRAGRGAEQGTPRA